jgi:hypothetical protein
MNLAWCFSITSGFLPMAFPSSSARQGSPADLRDLHHLFLGRMTPQVSQDRPS